jgi:DNA-binding transcriptional ArsR family regulator
MLTADELNKIRKTFNKDREDSLALYFKALSDINRQHIFEILISNAKMSASDIATALKISRPLASQHLKILEQAQLFSKEKVGQQRFYKLNNKNSFVQSITKIIKKFS